MEFFTELIEKINKKCENLSEYVFERTGSKINFSAILVGAIVVIIMAIFVKALLGWLWSLL